MGSSSVRAGRVGLAVLLLGTGAVACSKGASEESPKMTPAAAVAKAAKNVEDITSLSYRMTGKMPEEGRVKAEAKMRLKPDVAMSMKITALDKGADGTAEIRLVDKALFIGGGAAAAKEMDGKSWIKFDMAALGAAGESLGAAGQADKNPAQESTFLTGSKDVKEVGTETVDGVKTTHYKGTVSLDQFRDSLKSQSKVTREQREKSLEQYEKLGIDKFTMDMWIGADERTKQFRMRGAADKGPLDLTITFDDFNKPVNIAAPAAKDVADLAEMMKGAQAG
ncbi:DUF1396 domain-containing protein [Streptomyces sp. SID12488]|uniref:DUF1396 domain-containing protein n=1 Tax=Streptomyces sp. SID12488 TaxID=2706040 RepID=UPI0013D8E592|nr:DUF1396 domain-containing protein [Streptomyces sp. SID12488]NEA61766.1 DUF1396 domain-containing protein [Streptomyces sp. SID12488]